HSRLDPNHQDRPDGQEVVCKMSSGGIRTMGLLQDAMSAEFAWRKKELHGLKSIVHAHRQSHSRDLTIRAAVPLLYAHWEGFVKSLGEMYLEFVGRQKLRNDELPPHFLAMAISKVVGAAPVSSKIETCMEIVTFFR